MEKRETDHKVLPPGTKLKEIPWKKLVVDMRRKIEQSGNKLIEKRRSTDVRLEKKLGMMRLAILQQMHAKLKQDIDSKFFLDIIELLDRAEELLEEYEHDVTDWLNFLELLERKLEEEGMLLEDEDMIDQSKRLKHAIDRLRTKLEDRGPFKPLQ